MIQWRLGSGYFTQVNFSGRTIQRNPVAFIDGNAFHGKGTFVVINNDFSGSGNTAFTHTAGNNSCVRGHTPASGKDSFWNVHAA